MSQNVVCSLAPSRVLQLVWLAHCTGRTVAAQFVAMVEAHAAGVELPLGTAYHTHHCSAAVRLYGWPELSDAPAVGGVLRVRLRELGAAVLAELDKQAARAHRTRDGQASAVVESYLRTLEAARPLLDPVYGSSRAGVSSARLRAR